MGHHVVIIIIKLCVVCELIHCIDNMADYAGPVASDIPLAIYRQTNVQLPSHRLFSFAATWQLLSVLVNTVEGTYDKTDWAKLRKALGALRWTQAFFVTALCAYLKIDDHWPKRIAPKNRFRNKEPSRFWRSFFAELTVLASRFVSPTCQRQCAVSRSFTITAFHFYVIMTSKYGLNRNSNVDTAIAMQSGL